MYCECPSLGFAMNYEVHMYLDGSVPCIASNVWHMYFSEETYLTVNSDPGSTATVAASVSVPLVVLLLGIIAITIVGLVLWRYQKTVGKRYGAKVTVRTNGHYAHDGGNDRESVVEHNVPLGSEDEGFEIEEKKNSPAVDV